MDARTMGELVRLSDYWRAPNASTAAAPVRVTEHAAAMVVWYELGLGMDAAEIAAAMEAVQTWRQRRTERPA